MESEPIDLGKSQGHLDAFASKDIYAAFKAVLPSDERLKAIADSISLAASNRPDFVLLPYWRARLEEERDPGTPLDRVSRWQPVVEGFREVSDGEILRDAEARLGKALLESGSAEVAAEHLLRALTDYQRKHGVLGASESEPSASLMNDWEYDVTVNLGRAEVRSRDADRFVIGLERLGSLDGAHRDLGRDSERPSEHATDAIDEVIASDGAGERLDALVDRIVSGCVDPKCGSLHFVEFPLPNAALHRATLACAKADAVADPDYSLKLACLLSGQRVPAAVDLLRQIAIPPEKLIAGADVSKDKVIARARRAFSEKRYADAKTEIDAASEQATADTELRYRYWRGQCERHLGDWAAAIESFTRTQASADPWLAAWATYRIAQCRLRLQSSAQWLAISRASIEEVSSEILTAFKDLRHSRRIRFARGCLALALNDYNEAQSLFGEINSSFRYYRLSQWARCIALLHLGRLKEAELALSMPDEAGQSSEWPIPRSLASEILRLCGERQAPETISRVVYDEIRPDFKAEPEQWTDFFERAAVNHGHAFDRLLRDVQEAIDRAFNDALADALIDRLVTVAEICAEDLGRLRTIAPGLAETLQLIGRSDNAEVLLEKMLRSGPRADLIDVFTSYVSILRSANQANKAEDKIAEWHQALHAAGDDVRRRLSDLSGTISVDDAETNAARVIRATRIAIFGGHPRQRETCTAVLTKMGFAPKDISWLDANAGNGLTYSDCIDLINGTYDCYVVVTTRIGHATSLPIVFALKKKSAKWAPLGIYGYQNFEIQIREQMRAWDLLE